MAKDQKFLRNVRDKEDNMAKGITNFYEHKETQKPKQIIVLLHGVGSNGQDLMGLVPILAPVFPEAVFISPDAPFAYDMAPPGFNGFQWFSLQNRDPHVMLEGIELAFPLLENFIQDKCTEYELPLESLSLLGFSQGTMMSLYSGPRWEKAIAGILGYSGALLGGEGFLQDPEEYQKPPIHLVHGKQDDVVPVQAFYDAKQVFEQAGYTVSGEVFDGLGHGIDERALRSGVEFLQKCYA